MVQSLGLSFRVGISTIAAILVGAFVSFMVIALAAILESGGFTHEPKDGFVVVIVLPKIGGQGFKNRVQLIGKYE